MHLNPSKSYEQSQFPNDAEASKAQVTAQPSGVDRCDIVLAMMTSRLLPRKAMLDMGPDVVPSDAPS